MESAESRYDAATRYVRRAIATVESRGIWYGLNPITGLVEWYAGAQKTAPARNELARLDARWLRASTASERTTLARDAELLADHVEESLPGAPQDRARTNLGRDEAPSMTPPTSYVGEIERGAKNAWNAVVDSASAAGQGAKSAATWLLVGGALVVGWKAFGFLERRERRLQAELNGELSRTADRATRLGMRDVNRTREPR